MASVFFAVFLALLMRTMQYGTYNMMERDAVKNSTGYIQVHADGYWNKKTINNTFQSSPDLEDTIRELENVTSITPRLESFALGSSGDLTKGVAVIGTEPERENHMTGLKKRVVEGAYFGDAKNEVLLAKKLAEYLELGAGDTLVLLSQGYHGATAAGKYLIRGILDFSIPMMNSEMVYMKLEDAQYFYAAPGHLSSLSIMLRDPGRLEETTARLKKILGPDYEVMTWKQMMTALVQGIQSDNISGLFMLGILYLVVAFGIFGTMLMMTMERKKEFAVMVSVGMQRSALAFILLVETLCIAFAGVITGVAVSLPVIAYFHENPIELTGAAAEAMIDFNAEPILPFSLDAFIFANQALVVLILTLLAIIYPVYFVFRFNLMRAFRGK